WVDTGRDELLGGEEGDPLAPGGDVAPQLVDPLGTGEAAAHADDRNVWIRVAGPAGAAGDRRGGLRAGGAGARARKMAGERGDGRELEELDQRDLPAERLLEPRVDLGHAQRMPAQVEEVVLDPDGLDVELFLPDGRDGPFELALRRAIGARESRPRAV